MAGNHIRFPRNAPIVMPVTMADIVVTTPAPMLIANKNNAGNRKNKQTIAHLYIHRHTVRSALVNPANCVRCQGRTSGWLSTAEKTLSLSHRNSL